MPASPSPDLSQTTTPDTARHAKATRHRWIAAALSGILALLFYLLCLPPSVSYFGDCGELIAASYRLGIAHPSGYPFYCLLGRVWASVVPFGEIGWRYNLLSATLGAFTVAFVTASAHRWLWRSETIEGEISPAAARRVMWSSTSAGLALAGFYYFAGQNIIAEVYALNGFFLSALLYLSIAWHQDGDWRWLYALAFTFGLSLTAHLSGVFFAPGLFLFVVWQHRARFNGWNAGIKRWAILLALCATGFTLTLYLPLRSQLFPAAPLQNATQITQWWPLDWGHPADFAHWKAHISAAQYKHLLTTKIPVSLLGREFQMTWFAQGLSQWPQKVAMLGQIMALQFSWLLPFLLIGAARTFSPASASTCRLQNKRENRWMGVMLGLTWCLNIGVQINYNVNDLECFFFPAYIVQAMWMAFGLHWFLTRIDTFCARIKFQNAASMWPFRVSALARMTIVGGIIAQWILIWPTLSQNGDFRPRDRALERAKALETLAAQTKQKPVAFIFSNDSLWTFWYAQYVLGRARQTQTPWGALGNASLQRAPMTEIVAHLNAQSPVVLSQWDDKVDAKFPLEMISPTGILVRATNRILPRPATPMVGNGAKFFARFRRSALSRSSEQGQVLADDGAASKASFKRGDLAAFDVIFRPNSVQVLADAKVNRDPIQRAHLIGYIEVLIAQNGKIAKIPPPNQETVFAPDDALPVIHSVEPTIWAWKQRRRVVVSDITKPNNWLRASFALQIESDAPTGNYSVWTRFVKSRTDATTAWTKSDSVQLTHR